MTKTTLENLNEKRLTPSLEQVRRENGGKRVKKFDKRFLLKEGQQARAKATIHRITTAAEELLKDPSVSLNWISIQFVVERSGISTGSPYTYFEDIVALLDYIWPDRQTTPPKKKKKKKSRNTKDSPESPPQ